MSIISCQHPVDVMHLLFLYKLVILISGFDINYTVDDFDGGSALHIACMNLSHDSAKVLLEKGADVEFKNTNDQRPIGVVLCYIRKPTLCMINGETCPCRYICQPFNYNTE